MNLLPESISLLTALLLCGVSFLTSALTAAIGLGGGLALLSVMASLLPPLAVIPVHGIVQLGSNGGRSIIQRAHINWQIAGVFALGALVGAIVGGQVVFALPPSMLKGVLGIFILYMLWGPKPRFRKAGTMIYTLTGAVSTFLTMFVGATGPFVAAVLSPAKLTRHQMVATIAICMTQQHAFKILIFGLLGFAFSPWLILTAGMIATGFAGTLVGTRLLTQLPEKQFHIAFKTILTALALNLIRLSI